MSSARNHAKRSHRSEHDKRSSVNMAARKTFLKSAQKPKSISFIDRLLRVRRQAKEATN